MAYFVVGDDTLAGLTRHSDFPTEEPFVDLCFVEQLESEEGLGVVLDDHWLVLDGPVLGALGHASLLEVAEHEDHGHALVVDHPPEVLDGREQGALGGDDPSASHRRLRCASRTCM